MIHFCFDLFYMKGPKITIESNPAYDLCFENKQNQPVKKVAAAVRSRRATMVENATGFGGRTKGQLKQTTNTLCAVKSSKAIVYILFETLFGLLIV